jgi:small subunit ribosomal protein S14
MKALLNKNKIIRENFKKAELDNYISSALTKNHLLGPQKARNVRAPLGPNPAGETINKEVTTGFLSQVRNICVITGRSRAVLLKYKLSRIKFKQIAEAGLIPGIKKL